jgi:uncharacterized protein YqeY
VAASLIEKMNDDLKAAMRGGDVAKREVIRQALAAVQKAEGDRRATLAKAALAKKSGTSQGKEP